MTVSILPWKYSLLAPPRDQQHSCHRHSCVTPDCSLSMTNNPRQVREAPKWLQKGTEVGSVWMPEMAEAWGSRAHPCTHPECAACVCQALNPTITCNTATHSNLNSNTPGPSHLTTCTWLSSYSCLLKVWKNLRNRKLGKDSYPEGWIS